MGLNTTHGAWDGPYSMFNTFRYAVAKRIGIDLDEYFGYNPYGTKELDSIDHAVKYLLDHSDCDGELTTSQATMVAFGLEQIMNAITLDEMQENIILNIKANYRMQDFYQDCEKFKNGCLNAVRKNENLIFS
jgi:hypothetical protein